jgi:hypothetical protein
MRKLIELLANPAKLVLPITAGCVIAVVLSLLQRDPVRKTYDFTVTRVVDDCRYEAPVDSACPVLVRGKGVAVLAPYALEPRPVVGARMRYATERAAFDGLPTATAAAVLQAPGADGRAGATP